MFQKSWNWKRKNSLTSGCFKLWRKLKLYRLFSKLSKYLSFYPTSRTKVLKNSLFFRLVHIHPEFWGRGGIGVSFGLKRILIKVFPYFILIARDLMKYEFQKKFHMLAGFLVTSILLVKCQKSPSFRVPHITLLY